MALQLFTNNAASTLASGITSGATSLTVQAGDGALFPNPSGSDFFLAYLENPSASKREIVKCTSRSGDVLTIVRAQEGTTAQAFDSGDKVELRLTKGTLELFPQASDDFIHIRDEKTSGTHGGTFTNGAWRTRDLNTEAADTGGHASIASNQITLAAGTYRVLARAPASNVDHMQTRLYNITDSAVLLLGSTSFSHSAGYTRNIDSFIYGRFTITAAKTIELQHRGETTKTTWGFGEALTWGTNVYSEIMLWKEQ